MRGRISEVEGTSVVLLQRHSAGHKVPPHKVNYRAMALGLKELGVERCLATAAVGSLRRDAPAGTLIVPGDFLDLTPRATTLFDRRVAHTDFSSPFPAREALLSGAAAAGVGVQDGGVYVCLNGPRYETPYEIELYAKIGSVVGMTAASEAIVMREAGIPYAVLAIVTNLAAGLSDEPLSHGDVEREMQRSGDLAVRVLLASLVP